MPRKVSTSEKLKLVNLMSEKTDNNEPAYSQRQLEKITGLSRPFIRSIARQMNYQFPRNGIEKRGTLCICANCGVMFRRPLSKVTRSEKQFHDDVCRVSYMVGPSHPNWKTGVTAKSFSEWVKNQSEYKVWRDQVLAKADYKCEISGRTDNLEAHHLVFKKDDHSKVFDVDNGMCLNEEVHQELHQLASQGKTVDECFAILKEKHAPKA